MRRLGRPMRSTGRGRGHIARAARHGADEHAPGNVGEGHGRRPARERGKVAQIVGRVRNQAEERTQAEALAPAARGERRRDAEHDQPEAVERIEEQRRHPVCLGAQPAPEARGVKIAGSKPEPHEVAAAKNDEARNPCRDFRSHGCLRTSDGAASPRSQNSPAMNCSPSRATEPKRCSPAACCEQAG